MATCPTCRTHYPDSVSSCSKDGDGLLPDEAFSSADADLQPGRVVGEYRVEGKLGQGGFGTVYRAVHPLIGKAAAIKVLSRQFSSNPQMVARFIAEARAVNQIRHRHIIDIFAFGSLDDGRQYFVMELLEGMTLDAYLKQRGRLTPEQAIPILRAVGRALDAAHARDIAHRDLKPENVFLSMQDGEVFPKLLDFGIAKLMGESAGSSGLKTNTGTPIGTPHYMSPEQCRGRDVDHRTDVYSFGVMAHELLTGKLPFHGNDIMDLLMKQVMSPPPPMSKVCDELSPALDAAVLAMMEKEPDRRPKSLGEAVESLARAAREAGYDVALAPPPGESGPRIIPPAAGHISSAPTVGATPVSVTFQGTSSESGLAPMGSARSRSAALLVGGVAILCGAAFVVLRAGSTRPMATEPPTPAVVTSAVGTPPVPVTTSTVVEPAKPAATTAQKTSVRLDSTPPGALVVRGDKTLGKTPTVVELAANEKLSVALKLDGFDPVDVELSADAPNMSVPLVKHAHEGRPKGNHGGARKQTGGALQGELENPFETH